MKLEGTTALLTGASGGLGRAIASALADRGVRLVLSSRREAELEQLVAELPGEGHRAIVCDLAEPGAALGLAGEALAATEVDLFVGNAGLPASGELGDLEPVHVERALRVNLESPILIAQSLLPGMLARDRGHLVFVSSLAGKVAPTHGSVYAATKFGLRGFSRGLREDLRGTGVGSSVILPGFIRDAGMFADTGAKLTPGFGTGTPDQVSAAVIRVIERDRGSAEVAPPVARALTGIAALFPEVAGRAVHRSGQAKVGREVADGQRDKR